MHLEFSIKSSTHYLKFLRDMIDSLGAELDHKAKMSCSLALVEAVNNAIFHAHKKDPEIWIDISILSEAKRLIMEVKDSGPGFDMPEDELPPLDHDHGRGIFLIKTMLSSVKYIKGKKNILRMEYQL